MVSVVIACYNVEKYVEEAVRSVMNQTLRDIEIICVDDCSEDGTLAILERLAAEDLRIRVIKHEITFSCTDFFWNPAIAIASYFPVFETVIS